MKRTYNNVRFYQVLGLSRTDVTQEEIKKAFRKMSLKYHPDRNRDNLEEATAKMQEVNQAYSVLSDPRKKEVYDRYGENGLQIYEGYGVFTDADENGQMPLPPIVMLAFICIMVAVFLLAACGFALVLAMRMDGKLEWNWFTVFIPIWLIDSLLLCSVVVTARGVGGNAAQKAAFAVVTMFRLALLTATQVMLCMRLNNPDSISFTKVFTPVFISEGLNLAGSIRSCAPSVYQAQFSAGHTLDTYAVYVLRKVSWSIFSVLTLVFLVGKLEGAVLWSWWEVFGPLWAWVGLELLLASYSIRFPHAVNQESKELLQQLLVGRLGAAVLFAGMLLLVCLRVEGVVTATYYVFMPLFVAAGIFFCCCCCLICLPAGGAGGNVPGQEVPEGDGFTEATPKSEEDSLLSGEEKSNYGGSNPA